MEHFFGLQFDFENSSGASPPLEDNSLQEDNYLYEEISQGTKRAYQCTFPGCGKTFKYKSEMNRHSVIHQEERPYCCTFGDCKKNFKRPDALENHMRIHLGNLPFACDFPGCDKRFATKAAIRYHRIRHNNERIFKCEIPSCGKSFLTPSQLKQHQRACNLHYGFSPVKVEDEPIKLVKIEQKNPNENFLKTGSQPTNHIQWEVKTQTCEDETQGQMTPKQFEMIFSYLMNENKILKGQLHEREKFTNVNEKKLKVEHQSDIQVDFTPTMEPSSFFDDNELKFLEFLKGRENVSF